MIQIYFLKTVFPAAEAAARSMGYALGIHGSMTRDFDLIAVPWIEDAQPIIYLVQSIARAVGGTIPMVYPDGVTPNPCPKPKKRITFCILLGGNVYIDLSVMGD